MDGNKKITGIVCAGIIMLAITACKVQQPGYVGLYVDNFSSVSDTIDSGITPIYIEDTVMPRMIDTISVITAKLPVVHPVEDIIQISSDQLEVEKLLKSITDSVQLQRYQMIELQKQLAVMPDSSYTWENPQDFHPPDSLQADVDFKQLIQANNDALVVMRKQLNELQNFGNLQSDTVFKVRETVKSPIAENQQIDYQTQQLLRAMDGQNQRLQNQLNALQNAVARTPQQTYIIREPLQVQPLNSRQTEQLTIQMFQAQNDTIQMLRSQLRNQTRDSVYIEKAKEMQPSKELVAEQKASDLQELQNTIELLKTRVLSLEEQTLQARKTPVLANQVERDAPDTTLLVAFYKRGEINPLEEVSVLKQINELSSNKNVTKIMLSGFTDSSGNALINREITNKRLNYLSEKISTWFSKEEIFFQNFGDNFASEKMVSDERRIEIRILIK